MRSSILAASPHACALAAACALGSCAARPAEQRALPSPAPTPTRPTSASDGEPSFEPIALIPRPRSLALRREAFAIEASTRIAFDALPEARAVASQLARWLDLPPAALLPLPPGQGSAAAPRRAIVLAVEGAAQPARDPARDVPTDASADAYVLDVSAERALVRARSPSGLLYGAETLADLAAAPRLRPSAASPRRRGQETRLVPGAAIEDMPRFPFRAMHLDVARHFFDKGVVERYLDLLAFYRFNVFHWHLTDDQGFRFEVKSHPELTAVGGKGGFITQAEAAEVVAYARERGITVIPEIEMPGHARAILAAHPELSCTGEKQDVPRTWGVFDDVLCAGNDATYALIGDVLDEVASVFPSRLIHVGGDEVPPLRWSACPKCRALMKASRVDPAELESVFMRRIADRLVRLGRRMVVWDEALTPRGSRFPLPDDALVIAWQSKDRGREAALLDHDVVMAPHDHVYFNFQQAHGNVEPGHKGFLPWSKVRVFDPIPDDLEPARARRIVGGEGALWTEFVETEAHIETLVMPRMAALAEALWTGPAGPEADFVARFDRQLPALDAAHVRYFVEPPDLGRARPTVFLDAAAVSMTKSRLFPTAVVRWTEDGTEPSAGSPLYESPFSVHETTTVAAALFLPGGAASPVVRSTFKKEIPRTSLDLRRTTKGASYTYLEGDFHKVPDFHKTAPTARGKVEHLRLADVARAVGSAMRKEHFAVELEAFVRVPRDGIYRFIAKADDGVRVEVAGDLVVEDDGEHGPRESDGQIALAAGFHALRISFFQAGGGATLDLDVEGPDLPRGPVDPFLGSAR